MVRVPALGVTTHSHTPVMLVRAHTHTHTHTHTQTHTQHTHITHTTHTWHVAARTHSTHLACCYTHTQHTPVMLVHNEASIVDVEPVQLVDPFWLALEDAYKEGAAGGGAGAQQGWREQQ